MKKILFSLLILGLICVALVEAQISKEQQKQPMPRWSSSVTSQQKAVLQELIDGMVMVEGGTFTMGATSEQGSDAWSEETPTHRVTLSDYMIGKTEVTQEQWEAVMGSNPSNFKGSNLPVEQVSWFDCQEFIKKLNSLTGLSFRLPTEAEWEFAARGGAKSRGYKYSGSNDINSVAWYYGNAFASETETHTVATKAPNELGLYDMSGNVLEWCSDRYGDYSSSHQINPAGPSTGSSRVNRGGSWLNSARDCRVSNRYGHKRSIGDCNLGLRLALTASGSEKPGREMTIRSDAAGDEVYLDGAKIGVTPLATNLSFGSHVIELRRSGKSVLKEVNITASGSEKDILLTFAQQKAVLQELIDGMVMVEGGTFIMGATSEQDSDADSWAKPTHQVTLSDYKIGKTEVTQEQWEAVMGSNPSEFSGSNLPVESVSWNDCQEFIKRLNSLTGLSFRLPTEAEWEYAARGGAKSLGYKYSGSNDIDAVAWCINTTNDRGTKPVATKRANELGLYDMSGNVHEWCSDWIGDYSSSPQTNPKGPSTGSGRVSRGGSWCSDVWFCQVSDRLSEDPSDSYYNLGLRLAL